MYLAAYALGLGATGLTFFDDEVRAAFATHASCLLVTAVGASTYRPTPGGQPGRPTELIHFETLMARLEDRSRQQAPPIDNLIDRSGEHQQGLRPGRPLHPPPRSRA